MIDTEDRSLVTKYGLLTLKGLRLLEKEVDSKIIDVMLFSMLARAESMNEDRRATNEQNIT